ncbi:ABC transporter permease [Kitasatospora sp. NPDC097643]|uniref:ABC transporter permease n=1 Tax=Kitasatospora sp. NPDC097643 TaxID=3157230 RepID=UPI00332B82D6
MTTATHPANPELRLHRVLGEDTRPARRPGALSTSVTLGWRALVKIKRSPGQMFNATITPVMFTLIFTYLFGGAISGTAREYLQFLLPGILVQGVLFISTQTAVALTTDLQQGVFDRFRSLPIWRPSPLTGALIGDLVRYAISSVVVVAVGLALGFRPHGGALGVIGGILLAMLFGFCVSWVWTLLGLVLRTPQAVSALGMLLLSLLTFASNIFVMPATMPGWLKAFVDINPIGHVVTATRDLMSDGGTSELGPALLSCAVLLVVFVPLSVLKYNKSE